ncbi:MAG TPA: hypothetical protein VGI16_14645 [Candidatus Acidoferrum sp.]|jgi:O-antigen/teichoic acid export membrane protein
MKFAKITFYIAGIWGILTLSPLFFIFDNIGIKDPPAITHPLFFYGFAGVGIVWQFAFLVIASNPARFRPLMLIAILEKLSFFVPAVILYLQQRIHPNDFFIAIPDVLLAILFLIAYQKTPANLQQM